MFLYDVELIELGDLGFQDCQDWFDDCQVDDLVMVVCLLCLKCGQYSCVCCQCGDVVGEIEGRQSWWFVGFVGYCSEVVYCFCESVEVWLFGVRIELIEVGDLSDYQLGIDVMQFFWREVLMF